jgi:hypothetical protein
VADGNGFSLTCTQVQGTGLVASFTARGWIDRSPTFSALILNKATDKMTCGIIPKASRLVDRDFYCIRDDRQVDVLAAIIDQIDLESGVKRLLTKYFPESGTSGKEPSKIAAANETAILLCEFLPIAEVSSIATQHYFYCWNSGVSDEPFCVIRSPDGRRCLLDHLRSGKGEKHLQNNDMSFVRDSFIEAIQ